MDGVRRSSRRLLAAAPGGATSASEATALNIEPAPHGLQAAQDAAWHLHSSGLGNECGPAERSAPTVLRQVLTKEDIAQCRATAAACGRRSEPASAWRRPMPICDALCTEGATFDVVYSAEHVALYLHRDGTFATACPAVLAKLITAMRSSLVPGVKHSLNLHVRCVELHSYAKGGSLLDAGHKDNGSKLTLSVQLSEASAFSGGQFVTWDEGRPVLHSLQAGDAVLINSEKLHNVAPISHGIRHSLVCELWVAPANSHDRFA